MRRYIIIGIIWAIICTAAFMPARWGSGLLPAQIKAGIVPGSISGTLWSGQAKVLPPKTSWPLQISYKIKALAAIFKAPYAHVALSGNGFKATGQWGAFSQTHIRVKDLKAEFNIIQLPISDPRLAGLSGQAFVELQKLNMKKGCKHAQGDARTNILTTNKKSWQWSGPVLSGPITCDDKALLAALRGSDTDFDVALDLRIYPDGFYDIDMLITPKTTATDAFDIVLGLLGFEQSPDGSARLKEKGQIFQGSRNPNEF